MRLLRIRRTFLALILAAPGAAFLTSEATAVIHQAEAGAAPHAGAGMLQVGETKAVDRKISYGARAADGRQVFHHSAATYIKVHFSALQLAPGDRVTITDAAGGQRQTFHGDPTRGRARPGDSGYTVHGAHGFAALSIDGDTAIVQLHATKPAAGQTALAATVDKFWRGFTPDEIRAHNPELYTICGTDGRKDTVCYKLSHPTEYAHSGAVARQLMNGRGRCTTWRVGRTNRMMTNNHCASTAAQIAASEVQFQYECQTCGGANPGPTVKVAGAELIKTNRSLDYTLFSVKDFASIERFGTLFLETRAPVAGEAIYIPGHGSGKPKQISLHEETNASQRCTIKTPRRGRNTGYTCDTTGGNSGSPVIAAAAHKVIALHWGGGCPRENSGVRTELIYPDISGLIDNNG
jgi:V8-like Glu-specific endopeptidase